MKTYKDFFGQTLAVDDFVVTGNSFKYFGCSKIIRFTPKMVCIKDIDNSKEKLVYPFAMMKVDPHLVTFHMLTRKSK